MFFREGFSGITCAAQAGSEIAKVDEKYSPENEAEEVSYHPRLQYKEVPSGRTSSRSHTTPFCTMR